MGLKKVDSVGDIYVNPMVMKFKQVFQYSSSPFIFKFQAFSYFKEVFKRFNEVHGRMTRAAAFDLFLITPKVSNVMNSFIYKCPLYYIASRKR